MFEGNITQNTPEKSRQVGMPHTCGKYVAKHDFAIKACKVYNEKLR